jgi:hypothetical protein
VAHIVRRAVVFVGVVFFIEPFKARHHGSPYTLIGVESN